MTVASGTTINSESQSFLGDRGGSAIRHVPDTQGGGARASLFQFDLFDIWASVYRSRWWILGIIAAFIVLSIIYSLLATPIYQATATVKIEEQAAQVTGTEELQQASGGLEAERFLQTQLDIVRSRRVAREVAEDLNLFSSDRIFEILGENPAPPVIPGVTPEEAREQKVINVLLENMDVSIPAGSRLSRITFESPDPQFSASAANSFADKYISSNLQLKFDTSSYAREFLGQRLDEVRAELEQSERDALEYARSNQIVATDGGNGTGATLTASTLSQLNKAYSEAQARRIAAEEKWQQARSGRLLEIPEVLRNSAVQSLVQDRAELEADYEKELERRRENFPSVRQARAEITEIDKQIADIGTAIRASIRNDYEAARGEEKQLETRISQLRDNTLTEQTQAVELGIRNRSAQTNRQLYEQLLGRLNELNAESGIQSNNLSLVDRAVVPAYPISPNPIVNLILAIFAGLFVSAIFVFLRGQLFDLVRSPEDVRSRTNTALLAVIPKSGSERGDILEVLQDVKEPITEAYATARANIALASPEGLPRVLVFTSTVQGEGKSSSCLAIGVGLAKLGKRVLIIDADLRRPSQHGMLKVPNDRGLADLLTGSDDFAGMVRGTEIAGLSVLPSGGVSPAPTELISSMQFKGVIEQAKSEFDVVLLDSPPVLALADALLVSSIGHNVIYVIEAGRNRATAVKNAIERLTVSKATIRGTLLTKFDATDAGYLYSQDGEYTYEYD